jgi:hypothetical protein
MDYHEHMKEHYGRLAPENEENAAFRAEATQDLLSTAKNATRPTSRPKTVAKVHLVQRPHPRAWRTALSVSFCNCLPHYRAPLSLHLTTIHAPNAELGASRKRIVLHLFTEVPRKRY